jgi:mannosyltransferase
MVVKYAVSGGLSIRFSKSLFADSKADDTVLSKFIRMPESPTVESQITDASPQPREPSAWAPGSVAGRLVFVGVLILAAWLRLHALTARSFWFDEGISVGIARLDWTGFAKLLWHRESNMALYYLLLRVWMVAGYSEFWIRTFSVVCGVAGVAAIYAVGCRMFNRSVGTMAALLLAMNAFHVKYSQEARSYTLLVLLVTLSSLLLVAAVDDATHARRHWVAYAIISALAVYTHIFAVLVIAAHGVSLLALPRAAAPWRSFFASVRVILYLIWPIGPAMVWAGAAPVTWIPSPTASIIREAAKQMAGNFGWPLVAALTTACLLAIWQARRQPALSPQRWRYLMLLAWASAPAAIVLAASPVRPLFLARYLIISLPAVMLLAAVGLAALRPLERAAALIILLVLSALGTAAYYRQDMHPRDDWRVASRYLLSHTQPGDVLVFYTAPGRAPFEYYRWLFHGDWQEPAVAYPSHVHGSDYRDFIPQPLAEVVPDLPVGQRRVWLFLNQYQTPSGPDMGSQIMRAWLRNHYREIDDRIFEGLELVLYAAPER